ncbi:MAG TPA: hypothetical protein VMY59_09265 [Candidatus Thermoplasmatota archaeon]|nr:hypothetical protein [Candidatus Thermoplasmatota archaeon]
MGKKIKVNWWQSMTIAGFVAGWIARAAMDGKITRIEIDELITGILDMLGLQEISIE